MAAGANSLVGSVESLTLQSQEQISDLIAKLYTCESSGECLDIARALGRLVEKKGIASLQTDNVIQQLYTAASNKKSGLEREGGALGIVGLAEVLGKSALPILLPLLSFLLDMAADKGVPVREAAYMAVETILGQVDEFAVSSALPFLLQGTNCKWQGKLATLEFLTSLAKRYPRAANV
ncbi:hypothetical protein HDU91_002319 [Kappamyces sp. JEL0680]|nr:hypothetical protein HDU91_002319 [Kappamyces sp. JEL0680]